MLKSRILSFVISILMSSPFFSVVAQSIPATRLANWENAGLITPFTLPSFSANVKDFGAIGNGISDDTPGITAAINSLDGRYGLVVFPAGNYLIKTTLTLPDSCILYGQGSNSVNLIFNLSGQASDCINISKGQTSTFVPIIEGFQKGSQKIRVANPTQFSTGTWTEIRQENGDWDTNPVSWANYSVGQLVRIEGKSGDTLFLEQSLRIDYSIGLNPQIRKISPRCFAGVESLKIIRQDEPLTGAGSNISLIFASNCRIAGIESDHSVGAHVLLHNCSNIEISGCYFHDAFTFDGTGTRGYGVCLNAHTGECLIENNVFKHLRHAMMVKTGSNGNVFSSNYSIEPYRSETIHDFTGDISLHGHFAYANLFEGNVCQNIIIDHYWGPSGPWNTFFRNRAEWFGIIMTTDNGYSSNSQNFIGNEITKNGYNLIIQLTIGLYYILKGSDHYEWGNNSGGTIIPSGTSILDQESLYSAYKPEFWNAAISWPAVGYPNALNTGIIPAQARYQEGGKLTVEPAFQSHQTVEIPQGWSGISSFIQPYPCEVEVVFDTILPHIVIVYNMEGTFYPAQQINTLGFWNTQEGYIIKANQQTCLPLIGLDKSGQSIQLNAGWNLLPVLSKEPTSTDSVFLQVAPEIQLIKEIAGGAVYWPEQQITTLKWLMPGTAYFVKMGSSGVINFK